MVDAFLLGIWLKPNVVHDREKTRSYHLPSFLSQGAACSPCGACLLKERAQGVPPPDAPAQVRFLSGLSVPARLIVTCHSCLGAVALLVFFEPAVTSYTGAQTRTEGADPCPEYPASGRPPPTEASSTIALLTFDRLAPILNMHRGR